MPACSIRPATLADTQPAIDVLCEAATWLISRSKLLWRPEEFTERTIQPRIRRSELLVAEVGAGIVGVAYRLWEDRQVWPDRPGGEAAYLHKLAVRRANAGTGIPGRFVAWVADEAAARGCRYIRLDCAPRPALINVYQALGFCRVDDRQVGPLRVVRMELEIPAGS